MSLKQLLQQHQENFGPVVEFDPSKDLLAHLDFSKNNDEINEEILLDTNLFIAYVNSKIAKANARYGIGGYDEHRTIYSRSDVFDNDSEEPRRLHLGIDIWGKPHTKVMAPLDGVVYGLGFNNNFGDYGATIILTHNIEGTVFHTLYGHLSLNSLKDLSDGDMVMQGDVFAEFGMPSENGQWPPHLHFQIIGDIGDMRSDYPGVCKFSEREFYLNNCPDADLILGMMQFAK